LPAPAKSTVSGKRSWASCEFQHNPDAPTKGLKAAMDSVECIVVGAGVIGLAIARALALAGHEVFVLESADRIGTGTSSRNSEVIHAGIYYQPGSLKARLCLEGRERLYAYCAERGVGVEKCGKLIVAADAREDDKLADIAATAARNGVDDLQALTAAQAKALEPALACTSALLSPSTGIIDSHAYMLALRMDAEAKGAMFVFEAPALGATPCEDGFVVRVGGREPTDIGCRYFFNAAGLEAPRLAHKIEGLADAHVPQFYFSKGNYFVLSGRAPFRRLIYPIPVPGGIGIHLTLDLGHQARFGPDVEALETIDYAVDPSRADAFYATIRRYWPDLQDGALQPAYAGIRPKIGAANAVQDFVFQGPQDHGLPGLVNLFGIESPGLTSSLAIADHALKVAGLAGGPD
jgi:L-2-hydroxyglutarate oxidase LhgO